MKRIINILIVFITIGCIIVSASAEEGIGGDVFDRINEALPNEGRQYMQGESADNSVITEQTLPELIHTLFSMFKDSVTKPLKLLICIAGVILLCSMTESLRDSTGSSQLVNLFGTVSVIAGAGIITLHIGTVVTDANTALKSGGVFMAGFVPVFSGVIAVSGQPATAAVFNSAVLIAVQVFAQITANVLVPLTSCILAVSVAGAIHPELKIESVARLIKTGVVWILGLIMTLFVGLLTIQSIITASTDTVALKATKFAVSSFVPLVGGAVSDALNTVKGSIGVIKAGAGGVGIAAGCMVVAPGLISLFCYKAVLMIAGAISDVFGIGQITALIKTSENVITIIMVMLICFLLMLVVSVALIMLIGLGVQ